MKWVKGLNLKTLSVVAALFHTLLDTQYSMIKFCAFDTSAHMETWCEPILPSFSKKTLKSWSTDTGVTVWTQTLNLACTILFFWYGFPRGALNWTMSDSHLCPHHLSLVSLKVSPSLFTSLHSSTAPSGIFVAWMNLLLTKSFYCWSSGMACRDTL